MVVIEPTEVEERSNVNANPPKSETVTSDDGATAYASNRDASDGFETASEGEITDTDKEEKEEEKSSAKMHQEEEKQPQLLEKQQQPQQMEGKKQEEQVLPQTGDEEAKQLKALEEANDAKLQGNSYFGNGQYEEALKHYELALQVAQGIPSAVELCSVCHANRAVCFLKLAKYENTVKECTKALELNPTYLKALLRRAEAHEKLENFEEAIVDRKKILELDPSNDQARKAIRRLEPLAAEKREKLKEEMIGKLKEMGNSILGKFGMSIDNFKAVKDPNTGSYSISFQR